MRPFDGILWSNGGPGAWVFLPVPDAIAPPVTHGWGRTPVRAEFGGVQWETSIWRGKDGRSLLPIPKRVRGDAAPGDRVSAAFAPR